MKSTVPLIAIALSFLSFSCATHFTGSAHFPGGPAGCTSKCAKDGMVMSAFVHAGEYSSACVCQPRGAVALESTSGTIAAAVGVIMQVREAQQQQQMSATH